MTANANATALPGEESCLSSTIQRSTGGTRGWDHAPFQETIWNLFPAASDGEDVIESALRLESSLVFRSSGGEN